MAAAPSPTPTSPASPVASPSSPAPAATPPVAAAPAVSTPTATATATSPSATMPAAATDKKAAAPAAAEKPKDAPKSDKDKEKEKQEKPLVDYNIHVKAPAVTPEMEEKLKLFRAELAKEKIYKENAAMRYYCDPQMLHRYLRARGGNIQKAKEMMLASLEWRKEMRPELIRAPDMAVEGRTGKVVVGLTTDRHNRPVMCMDGSKENTKNAVDQLRFVAWSLHRTWMKMKDGVEKYVLFINLTNYSFFNSPPIRTTLETVKTLVSRYPEHMGHCIMFQAPRLFSALWAMATPIIDAHMLSKVLFVQGDIGAGSKNDKVLTEIIGANWKTLCYVEGKEYEKTCPIGFDHAAYWPQVLKEDKEAGDKYTELEAAWAKEDGRPVRDSSNVGIPPANVPNPGVASPTSTTAAAPTAADGKTAAPAATPTSTTAGTAGTAAATSTTPSSPVVTVTPATNTSAASASPARPVPIATSKADLVSPLPAPPAPNTPVVIPPEALGSTPTASVRALDGSAPLSATPPAAAPVTVTPPTSQTCK